MAGVSSVKVHFASARIEIEHDPEIATVQQLIDEVARAGYTATYSAF